MNTLRKIGLIGLVAWMAIGLGFTGRVTAQPGMSVPVETFYDELAPYGQWTSYPGYGNVWSPSVGPDFQPYASNGHWVVTEYGNTWVSDYDWGWAPFHYGRWIYDPAYGGWLWVPDSDWGPAWVSWRSGGGYYGWAPLGPGAGVNVNINLPAFCWTFVPQAYITSPRLYSYRVPRPNVVNIYQNTTIINNVYRSNNRAYVYGPQRMDIERVTRQSVPVYRIDQLNRPGRSVVGNGAVGFYHPGGRTYDRDYGRIDRNPGRDFNNYNAPNAGYGNGYPGGYPNGGSRNGDPRNGGFSNSDPRNGGFQNGSSPNGGSRNYDPNGGRWRSNESETGGYGRPGSVNEGRGGYAPVPGTTPNRGFDNTPGRSYERTEQPQRGYPGNDMNQNRQNGLGGQQPERSYDRNNQPGGMPNQSGSTPGGRQERTYQQPSMNGDNQGGRDMGGSQRTMPSQSGQPGGGGERHPGGRGPR